MMNCTRCQGTGWLNIEQVPDGEPVAEWAHANTGHDVQVCDCCGDGEDWYGQPGEHYGPDDPRGLDGPYAYNGGLCECH